MKALVAPCVLALLLICSLVGCKPDYSDSELLLHWPGNLDFDGQVSEATYFFNEAGEPCGAYVNFEGMPPGTGSTFWTGKASSYGTPIVVVEVERQEGYTQAAQAESYWYYSADPEKTPVEEVLLIVIRNIPHSEYSGPIFYVEPDPGQFDDQ